MGRPANWPRMTWLTGWFCRVNFYWQPPPHQNRLRRAQQWFKICAFYRPWFRVHEVVYRLFGGCCKTHEESRRVHELVLRQMEQVEP